MAEFTYEENDVKPFSMVSAEPVITISTATGDFNRGQNRRSSPTIVNNTVCNSPSRRSQFYSPPNYTLTSADSHRLSTYPRNAYPYESSNNLMSPPHIYSSPPREGVVFTSPPSSQAEMTIQKQVSSDTYSGVMRAWTDYENKDEDEEMFNANSHMPKLGGKKKRYDAKRHYQCRMSDSDTKLLINLWKENYASLKSTRPRPTWQLICERFNAISSGPERSMKDIKNKIHYIVSSYRIAKRKNEQIRNNSYSSTCYEEIDSFLAYQQQTSPQEAKEPGIEDTDGNEDDNGIYIKETNKEKDELSRSDMTSRGDLEVKNCKGFQKDLIIERLLAALAASEERHFKFMCEMVAAQARRDEKEKERDKEFFLKLAALIKN